MPNIIAEVRMASDENTKGIVPPMLRAISHLAFCAMQLQAESNIETFTVPNEDYVTEIDRAIQQWEFVIRPVYINKETVDKIRAISAHWNLLRQSVTDDNRETFYRNVMTMLTEIVSLGVLIDQSAWGLKFPEETDAGREL